MRFSGIRLALAAAFASATVGLFVWATERTYGDTVFVLPTSTTVSISSPYVLPTAYVRPSSYLLPSYVETSYSVAPAVSLVPTGYIETTYRRGLFGRRWVVERPVVASYPTAYIPTVYVSGYVPATYVSSYVPTTYVAPTYYSTSYRVSRYRPTAYTYYPTVYETAYTTAPDVCCDEVVVDSTVRAVPQSGGAVSALSRAPRDVESGSTDADYIDSNVTTPLPEELAKQRSTLRGDGTQRDSPPKPPVVGADEAAATKAQTGRAGTSKNAAAQKAAGTPESKKAAPPPQPMTQAAPTCVPHPRTTGCSSTSR